MVFVVVALIALLVVMIGWGKIPPFVAFLLTALAAAFCFGMPLDQVAKSMEKGVGDMLGGLTAIICLGAMFGRAIADSGAAQSIARTLIQRGGPALHPAGHGPDRPDRRHSPVLQRRLRGHGAADPDHRPARRSAAGLCRAAAAMRPVRRPWLPAAAPVADGPGRDYSAPTPA
jgi:hypothetical protein